MKITGDKEMPKESTKVPFPWGTPMLIANACLLQAILQSVILTE